MITVDDLHDAADAIPNVADTGAAEQALGVQAGALKQFLTTTVFLAPDRQSAVELDALSLVMGLSIGIQAARADR